MGKTRKKKVLSQFSGPDYLGASNRLLDSTLWIPDNQGKLVGYKVRHFFSDFESKQLRFVTEVFFPLFLFSVR